MAQLREESARLPNGQYFETWEVEPKFDRELHVNCAVAESGDGSAARPFKTIGEAAAIATPGTKVLIHAGTYRETVKPARGGESPEKLISYEAAGDLLEFIHIVCDYAIAEIESNATEVSG